jgi:sporulation protein YlmC with PRC-barrel domain
VLERGYVLRGVRIHTTKGLDLGEVGDVLFDPTTGIVEGFLLSGRADQDFLPYTPSFVAGEDVAFVDPSAEATITSLKKVLSEGAH